MEQLGPLLAQALIYNIGGNAARSELDKLSEPLKKLVVSQVRSKKWLEAALLGDGVSSQNITTKEKIVFLQKIIKYVKLITPLALPKLLTFHSKSSWCKNNKSGGEGLLASLQRFEFCIRIMRSEKS